MREGGFRLLSRSLGRGFCTSSTDKIVAAVLFERLPVVIPKIDPVIYAFQEYSFRWRQQYRRRYPDGVLTKSDARRVELDQSRRQPFRAEAIITRLFRCGISKGTILNFTSSPLE
ncbi:uncharacterized protein LOC122077767 isoform X3 [Macadamia integrifolia]|uniref:uncharacterized protein LOC122077767 isoform X3 n=1 Tax=Macadamia integrifolia TaxID=60698 RepID=UPI001C4F75F6|nr:uncharacterized protein LOC122077767 isoform X3 [Macadamia integrifolia]